eukprot:4319008-Amphidinium_carterae.1
MIWSASELKRLTCREHIRREKIACRDEGRSTGKLFWQKIRAWFDTVDDCTEALSIADGIEMPEPIWTHFKSAIFRHERAPLMSWLKMQTAAPSETVAKVVCMCLVRLSPNKAEQSFHTGLSILQFMQRVEFEKTFPRLFEAIRPRVDMWLVEELHTFVVVSFSFEEVILRALADFTVDSSFTQLILGVAIVRISKQYLCCEEWKAFAMTGDDPATFVEDHSPMVWMLLPRVETETIMALPPDAEWKDHAQTVRYVYSSSRLGQSLMGGAIVAVSEYDVEKTINEELDKLGSAERVDDKMVAATLQSIGTQLGAVAGVQSLVGRRKPSFKYRGISITLPVQSLEHQFETALAVRLRQEAVRAGKVKELPAEADLCSAKGEGFWNIADSLILGPKKARILLWEKMAEMTKDDKKNKKEKKEKDGNAVEAIAMGTQPSLRHYIWNFVVDILCDGECLLKSVLQPCS